MKTATITKLTSTKQRQLIERALELKKIIDGAQDEYDEITAIFKGLGDGTYAGAEGHKVVVSTSTRETLDRKIVEKYLTPDQRREATKTGLVTKAIVS